MKNLLLPLIVAGCMGIMATSCDNKARLAKELPGEWVGTPENFSDNSVVTASIIDTYLFSPDTLPSGASEPSGPIVIEGMISTSTQIVADSSFIEPIALTAAARSSIKGEWKVVDNDEITLSLDPSTLTVTVDPSGLAFNSTMLAEGLHPDIDSLRPAVCANLEQSLLHTLPMHYATLKHLDDVKIKGSLLRFELHDIDYVLTRQ